VLAGALSYAILDQLAEWKAVIAAASASNATIAANVNAESKPSPGPA
jgi:hypothetical protein